MPKRIVILDPNGVEVVTPLVCSLVAADVIETLEMWEDDVAHTCEALAETLKRENPKLGTYTVTVKEIGDD